MTLFLSDLHLGRASDQATRDAERDAVALLEAHEDEIFEGGRLVLVGDVFHEWIEYKHVAPKRGLRLLGLLARWCDAGAEVHYLVGNRDPWHVDLMEREVGVRLWRGPWTGELDGTQTYIAHGDGIRPPQRAASRFLHRLQPLVRHPHTARLYRTLLPGDAGFALARWVSRTFGSDGSPDPDAHHRVSDAAREILATTDSDLVVMGHSHQHALDETPDGTYLNPGYWFGARTFARLDAGPGERARPSLHRWTGTRAEPLHAPALATA
ncbi:MAG: UDP-2,3-diacylglucosamine diphosphatase [Bacteroidota bacterium]